MPTGSRRIVGFDLIRGVAILLVLLRHAWPELFAGGGVVGVTVFFALSGYLITGLLRDDVEARGRVRYGRFYLHRVFRLVPPLLAMLAVFAVVTVVWDPLGDRWRLWRTLGVALTYTSDIPLPGLAISSGLGHLWTLAVEEQFYLLWPLVLAFGLRRRAGVRVTVVGIVGCLLACGATAVFFADDPGRLYKLPTSWFAAMLIGALARLVHRPGVAVRVPRAAAAVGLVVLAGLSVVDLDKGTLATYLVVAPVIAVCTVALIRVGRSWRVLPSRALLPLLGLGTVSYAAYLWNYPVVTLAGGRPFSLARGSVTIALTVVAAVASWYVVERPARRARAGIDARRETTKTPPTSEEVGGVTAGEVV